MRAEIVELRPRLVDGLNKLQLFIDESQTQQLLNYLDLLSKWNKVYNLTALRKPQEMLTHHLLDSLAVVPAYAHATRILDVGSGGGLPGIVLAVVYPHCEVNLIDIVSKKTAFLTQVKAELGLKNLKVHTGRVEEFNDEIGFDVITSRAFSELTNFVNWSHHLLQAKGQFIAMKGQMPEGEIQALPPGWQVTKIQAIEVPNLDAQRHLLWLSRQSSLTQ